MKRILYSVLALTLSTSILVGCNSNSDSNLNSTNSTTESFNEEMNPNSMTSDNEILTADASGFSGTYQVILSHDGHPDPDDNAALLVGTVAALHNANGNSRIKLLGMIYGDTTESRQKDMLNASTKEAKKPTDAEKARANYLFFTNYGEAALKSLNLPDNFVFKNVTSEKYNFDAKKLDEMTAGGQMIANNVLDAINNKSAVRVVLSAGGGENCAAEAVAYLKNKGKTDAVIKEHFAVVQHSAWNWKNATEDKAQKIIANFTIRIEDQNKYTGSDITTTASAKKTSEKFVKAWTGAVVNDEKKNPIMKEINNLIPKRDASDAGSHHFASDSSALDKNWNTRNNKLTDDKGGLKYDVYTKKALENDLN